MHRTPLCKSTWENVPCTLYLGLYLSLLAVKEFLALNGLIYISVYKFKLNKFFTSLYQI